MKLGLKFVDAISHSILVLFVFLVISVATTTTLFRHYLPNINEYRVFILDEINKRSRSVVIDAREVKSNWNLFRPEITLYGVSVRSNRIDDDLYLEKLQIKINLIKTLLRQKIFFEYVEMDSLDLLLIEDDHGRWSFANLKSDDREKQSLEKIINRLWAVDGLALHHINLSLLPYGGKKIQLPSLRAKATSYKNKKNFIVELMDGKKRISQIIVHTHSQPAKNDFALQAYVELNNYAFTELGNIIGHSQIIKNGQFSNQLWINWRDNKLDFSGRMDIKNLEVEKNENRFKADVIKADIFGGFDGSTYYLGVPKTHINIGQENLSINSVKLTYKDNFKLLLEKIDLPLVKTVIKHGNISTSIQTLVDTLDPGGSLKNVSMVFGKELPFEVTSNLENVSVGAWNGAPELLSVNGFLHATKEEGFVEFDTYNFSLFFPKLYKKPMIFDKARGYIDWSLADGRLYVSGSDIKLDAEYGNAKGEFSFSMPRLKSVNEPPRLSLSIGLKNSHAKFRNIFIPYTLSEKLLKWLDVNIQDGMLPEVGFIYHGPTQKESNEQKAIQLWLNLKDAKITYADKWPAIEHMNGEFLWSDDQGFAQISDAITEGIAIKSANFELKPFNSGQKIEVDAKVESSGNQVLTFLKNEALFNTMGGVLGDWESVDGHAMAQVTVSLLLSENKVNTLVNVDSTLDSLDLYLPKQNIKIQDISGNLGYNSSTGLYGSGLTARFLERPLDASVISVVEDGKINTSILLESSLAVSDIVKWTGLSLLNFATGSSLFKAEISYGTGDAELTVNSDLKGIRVNLPKPFKKKPEDTRSLSLNLPLKIGPKELDIIYGQGINSHFLYGEQGIEAGTVNLGLNRSEYQQGKIVLGGQIRSVNIEEWQDVVTEYKKLTQSGTVEASGTNPSLVFLVENLQIRQLKGYNQMLDMVRLNLFNTPSYWQLGIDHKDLKATLKIFEEEQPMELTLHRVNLEFLSKKQEESGVSYQSNSLSKFPDINVTIDSLMARGEDFGEWEFKVRSYEDHMALEDIQASFKAMRLSSSTDDGATLYWNFGEQPVTHFKGRFVSENIANVLKAWGYEQEVHSESAEFNVESFWDGVPSDFAFNNINATSHFKLEKGNFANVSSSSAGALKLIGIFNIANLVKRLKLDFSDLTSEGLAYDKVSGFVRADHGVYHFDKPVTIKSAASKIRIYGGFDMNTDQLDMTMGVTLPLASNLPWIVALAAGLPTAAGVYIVSKVLDKQVDKISSAVYTVTGDFSDPRIKFDSLFDTEEAFQQQRVQSEKIIDTPLSAPSQ